MSGGQLSMLAAALLLLATPFAAAEVISGECDQIGTHYPKNVDNTIYLLKGAAETQPSSRKLSQDIPTEKVTELKFAGQAPKDSLLSGFKIQANVASPSKKFRRHLAQLDAQSGVESGAGDVVFVDPNSVLVTDKGSEQSFTPINGVIPLTTIVFILNIGGQKPPVDVNKFKSTWTNYFRDLYGYPSTQLTMEDYFNQCSKGKMQLNATNTVIDLLDKPMPMTGRTAYSGMDYDMNKCGYQEIYAMQEWGRKKFEEMGQDITPYVRRIILLPKNNCPWLGLGSQGCYGSYCYSWIRGDRTYYLNTFFHELGHTLNLQHSSTDTWEYGDCSCAMGCAALDGCYNAPTGYRAGWYTPQTVWTGENLTAGTWIQQTIPRLLQTDKNFIRINPTWDTDFWKGTTFPAYYLSYRTAEGPDKYINWEYRNKISIHKYSGNSPYDSWMPNLQGNNGRGSGLTLGNLYNDTNSGFVVRFLQGTSDYANVEMCRYSETFESDCADGKDNDCDGLIDMDDPDCKSYNEQCGNGVCGVGENSTSCPQDCPSICGDGLCWPLTENAVNCPQDCTAQCSDGICTGDLNAANCPSACPAVCGDGFCTHTESAQTCSQDCPAVCGDGFCDFRRGEDCGNCKIDCPTFRCPSPDVSSPPPRSPPPPPPPPPPSPATGGCGYTLRSSNHWCAVPFISKYSINSVAACAQFCLSAGSTPSFCFDYNQGSTLCECSRGPDNIQPANSYDAYDYTCGDTNNPPSSPSPPPPKSPSPPPPKSPSPPPPKSPSPPPPKSPSPPPPKSPSPPPPKSPSPPPPKSPSPPPPKSPFPPPSKSPSPPPPKSQSPPPLSACGYTLTGVDSWCAAPSVFKYNFDSVDACAQYCLSTGSTPTFCFDYNPTSKLCECSRGTDPIQSAPGYNAYDYACGSVASSPPPRSPSSPPPRLPSPSPPSVGSCGPVLLSKGAWCNAPFISQYNLGSVDSCATFCLSRGSSAPFCFDYRVDIDHCECSRGPDVTSYSASYDAYEYRCPGRRAMLANNPSHGAAELNAAELAAATANGDILVPYLRELHIPSQEEETYRRKLLALETGRDKTAVCGDGVCSGTEDGDSCPKDCCPATSCGDSVCQAFAGEHCESCPEDCAGDLDGKLGAPFCCGAYIGCSHDERCTGLQLWQGKSHSCQMSCI